MKIIKIENQKPVEGEWYIVRCPEYSESGYEIAQWVEGEWVHGHMAQSCHKYVVGYNPVPLSEL